MRELPDLGKLGRRFGGGEWGSLKLRQPGLHQRRHQSENEERLRRGRILLLGPVVAILNRTASVTLAVSRGSGRRIDEAAALEEIQPW